MTDAFKVGDIVSVNFHSVQHTLCERAFVLHIPYATGDSWVFRDLETGIRHAVSEGCTVTLLKGGGE